MLFKNLDIHKLWRKKSLINYLLLPLSLLWFLGSKIRKLKSSYRSNLFVICLGNINLGGSGKTPTAIFLGKSLNQLGLKVAFLSKGYGGSFRNPTWVNKNHTPSLVGDEPLLLANYLPTLVSKNIKDGLNILEKEDFQMVITDDGFQNPTFKKDFNLLIVNGDYGFGNKLIFPAGPLRESIKSGFKKANAVIILEKNNQEVIFLAEKYSLNIFQGKYQAQEDINIKGDKVLAFCGIGIPEKFKKTLESYGAKVEKFIYYKDHHFYSKKDIKYLIKKANNNNLILVTTEKDYIKIPFQYKSKVLSFNISLVLNNSQFLLNKIVNAYETK